MGLMQGRRRVNFCEASSHHLGVESIFSKHLNRAHLFLEQSHAASNRLKRGVMTAILSKLTCTHCLAPSRTIDAPLSAHAYGRLFPELPALVADEPLLWALGGVGGLCDGGLVVDAEGGDDAQDVSAGWPFFGQLVAHDITADRSLPVHQADPATLRNARRPTIDLEFLYGDGPTGNPYLYDRIDSTKLLPGSNDAGRPDDLPRNAQGVALIGDPRNDTHLFVSQLHVAMLKLHNVVVDRLRARGVSEEGLFEEARRITRWHYQWVVLHDFLPRLIGNDLASVLLAQGSRYFVGDRAQAIPLEFADAAYRYGHSQIRHRYQVNSDSKPVPLFPDLIGFDSVPARRTVDWGLLFDLPGKPPAQRAKKIDGRLARSLIELPLAITGNVEEEAYHSLAVRDLQRGQGLGLPSGEAVARLMGEEPLSPEEVGLIESGWSGETPLWFYVLKEADVRHAGERLGPVGGRIVGEVLTTLIDRDPGSYRVTDPDWTPTLPTDQPGQFGLADLLTITMEAA
jgi:hypothetical protein